MSLLKGFFLGIVSGLIIFVIGAFLLNPTITFRSESNSYIDLNQAIPHYEFSTDETPYIEFLDITYKIRPPFYVFSFNSQQEISKPEGYTLREKYPKYDDCASWADLSNILVLQAKTSQFKVTECSTTLTFVKNFKKSELVNVIFNSSWRNDYEGNKFYEEEGISLLNKVNIPIKNYIFIYNQTNSSEISKTFKDCNELKTFINQKEIEYRYNLFGNSSIIAIKLDLKPREPEELIIRCYH